MNGFPQGKKQTSKPTQKTSKIIKLAGFNLISRILRVLHASARTKNTLWTRPHMSACFASLSQQWETSVIHNTIVIFFLLLFTGTAFAVFDTPGCLLSQARSSKPQEDLDCPGGAGPLSSLLGTPK
jgi:hypothetical protein